MVMTRAVLTYCKRLSIWRWETGTGWPLALQWQHAIYEIGGVALGLVTAIFAAFSSSPSYQLNSYGIGRADRAIPPRRLSPAGYGW